MKDAHYSPDFLSRLKASYYMDLAVDWMSGRTMSEEVWEFSGWFFSSLTFS